MELWVVPTGTNTEIVNSGQVIHTIKVLMMSGQVTNSNQLMLSNGWVLACDLLVFDTLWVVPTELFSMPDSCLIEFDDILGLISVLARMSLNLCSVRALFGLHLFL
jgi:hypothetical protein